MSRLNTRNAPRLKEPLQPFVPERFDHSRIIARCAMRNKPILFSRIAEPFRIKVGEPIKMSAREPRERHLREAHYNLIKELLRDDAN
jgi:hypothetical protein